MLASIGSSCAGRTSSPPGRAGRRRRPARGRARCAPPAAADELEARGRRSRTRSRRHDAPRGPRHRLRGRAPAGSRRTVRGRPGRSCARVIPLAEVKSTPATGPAVRSVETGAPFRRKAGGLHAVGDSEGGEGIVRGRQQRLADVKARELLLLEQDDAVALLGQADRRRSAGGAAASDGEVEIVAVRRDGSWSPGLSGRGSDPRARRVDKYTRGGVSRSHSRRLRRPPCRPAGAAAGGLLVAPRDRRRRASAGRRAGRTAPRARARSGPAGRPGGPERPRLPGRIPGPAALRPGAGAVRRSGAGARAGRDPGALRCRRLSLALRRLAARGRALDLRHPARLGRAPPLRVDRRDQADLRIHRAAARGRRLRRGAGRRRGAARGLHGSHRGGPARGCHPVLAFLRLLECRAAGAHARRPDRRSGRALGDGAARRGARSRGDLLSGGAGLALVLGAPRLATAAAAERPAADQRRRAARARDGARRPRALRPAGAGLLRRQRVRRHRLRPRGNGGGAGHGRHAGRRGGDRARRRDRAPAGAQRGGGRGLSPASPRPSSPAGAS